MDDVEIDWLSNDSETLAFWKSTKSRNDMSALSKETRKRSSEALKDYDYLQKKLDKSVLLTQENLEKILALMKEEDGSRVRIMFGDDKPVFFQKERPNNSVTFRGIIAPMIETYNNKEQEEA